MNPSNERARDIINQLTVQLAKGWQTYLVAKHVHERRASKRISSMVYFFNTVEISCLETTILTLSKLLVSQAASISVPYLLNFVEQNPSAFPEIQRERLIDLVNRHREELRLLEPLVNNLRQQRDRTIAHLDKLHVTNPSVISSVPPLNYLEVEKVFRDLTALLNEYASHMEPSSYIFLGALEPNIIEDVEYLTKLIEDDDTKE
ncbi:MAG: hypothetical protein JW963_01930 [Anaerolineales bacterium]|nr:hypothetical protein [Anaerolineales bacterium]